jgi:uncharacterized protein YecA (UPF0149 family)
MQETYDPESLKYMRELFYGKNDKEVIQKMDVRFEELKKDGHELIQRIKIGRNDPCPCGSGLKFKKCHLGKDKI